MTKSVSFSRCVRSLTMGLVLFALSVGAHAQKRSDEVPSPAPQTKQPASFVEGLGTPGTIPRWNGTRDLGDSVIVQAGTKIGIGTSSPSVRLEVVGQVLVNGTLTLAAPNDIALNIAGGRSIYKNGKLFIHTKGGFNNTALGYGTLPDVSTGAGNTAIGAYALKVNTTGNYNTASGVAALYSNTTGYRNVAIGGYSMFANTDGKQNVTVGGSALLFNTSGSNNVGIGDFALANNTTGENITASVSRGRVIPYGVLVQRLLGPDRGGRGLSSRRFANPLAGRQSPQA